MRKVILYIAASLDGYIARKDGRVDWLDSLPNPDNSDYGYHDFYESIDTTLMGNATYQQVLSFDLPFPYQDKKNYVLSRTPQAPKPFVEFISGDIPKFVKELKSEEGKNIWLIGGGQVNNLFLKNHLIDEIILSVFPVVLGEGIPNFASIPSETWLELKETKSYASGITKLHYLLK